MLRTKMGGVDLNLVWRYSEVFRGASRERRQNAFCPTDGFSALEHLHAGCRALRWRCSGTNAVLRGAIPSDGVCATDLSGKPARHRSLRVGSSLEALPRLDLRPLQEPLASRTLSSNGSSSTFGSKSSTVRRTMP